MNPIVSLRGDEQERVQELEAALTPLLLGVQVPDAPHVPTRNAPAGQVQVNRPTETGSAGHHNPFFLSCLAEMDEFAESSFSSQPQVRIRRSSYISQPSAHTAPVGWSPRAATPVLRHRLSTNSVRSDAYVGLFVICIGIEVLTRSF